MCWGGLLTEIENSNAAQFASIDESTTLSASIFYSPGMFALDPIPETVVNWTGIPVLDSLGQIQFATLASDLQFIDFANYLTNGKNDNLRDGTSQGDVSGETESHFFSDSPNGIDWQGYTITSIGFTITDIREVANPNVFVVDTKYSVYGVPEPATLCLLCVDGSVLLRRHHPRK